MCITHFFVPNWPDSSPPRHGRKRNAAAKLCVVPTFFARTFYLVYMALDTTQNDSSVFVEKTFDVKVGIWAKIKRDVSRIALRR